MRAAAASICAGDGRTVDISDGESSGGGPEGRRAAHRAIAEAPGTAKVHSRRRGDTEAVQVSGRAAFGGLPANTSPLGKELSVLDIREKLRSLLVVGGPARAGPLYYRPGATGRA